MKATKLSPITSTCNNCGTSIEQKGYLFCPYCGYKIIPYSVEIRIIDGRITLFNNGEIIAQADNSGYGLDDNCSYDDILDSPSASYILKDLGYSYIMRLLSNVE